MIYILGDIHGNRARLQWLAQNLKPEDIVIQVGDFGIYGRELFELRGQFFNGFPCKVYVIDGNHEDFRIINEWSKSELTEFAPNFFYVSRGYVMEIEGQLFGFLGGAESVDRAWRTLGVDHFAEERVSQEDVDLLVRNVAGRQLDVLITHSPPQFAIAANFPPLDPASWGLPLGWIDESAWKVSKAHWALKPKKHYCGHMHKAVTHGPVRILDSDEVLEHRI